MSNQIETAGFHEPPSIYTTLSAWMRHREAMWSRLEAISDPDGGWCEECGEYWDINDLREHQKEEDAEEEDQP